MFVFFFKQKTAYEMRISDWSSDVCSSDLVIVVDRKKDLDLFQGEHKAITTREYITNPEAYKLKTLKVVNLSGQCAYLDIGYYCSLLAEARSQKVLPTVDTILALERKTHYAPILPVKNAFPRHILNTFAHAPQ